MNKTNITRKNAVKILDWCKLQYGVSKINGTYPTLKFHRTGKIYAGMYDAEDNVIHVWAMKHRTFLGFIGTMIHEYTHYHQSIKRKYMQLELRYSYKNHPLEREAIKVEKQDKWKCYYDLFKD